jgi:glucosyl-dolichyl phosphate glucuronosyltransferase
MNLCAVICTKERSIELLAAINSLYDQTEQPDGIVIVDDSNNPSEIFPYHFHYYRPQPPSTGLTQARNYALTKIPHGTNIVLFLDDDVILDKDYIKYLKQAFKENPGASGINGFIETPYYQKPWYHKVALGMAGIVAPHKVPASFWSQTLRDGEPMYPVFAPSKCVQADWLSGCNMAYREQVFRWWEKPYRFDETLRGYCQGEDIRFSRRLREDGHLLMMEPRARLVHLQKGYKCRNETLQ